MASSHSRSSTGSMGGAELTEYKRVVKAASRGDWRSMQDLVLENPNTLRTRTRRGNTCLHISSMHGHQGFCENVVELEVPLLSAVNVDGETPLVIAAARGHASLASFLLRCCCQDHLGLGGLRESVILQQDVDGCNALHHAIRGGHKELALELIAAEPALSQHVNKHGESPMYMAVMKNWEDVFEKLLEIPDSAHKGAAGFNALHAAVRNGNSVIASKIMKERSQLARSEGGTTPTRLAVLYQKTDVLGVLLEHDASLGYEVSNGDSLLYSAACRGHVAVARKILEHCPDAPFRVDVSGCTCLHGAVFEGHTAFVQFILNSPQLGNLVNMRDRQGRTALHQAVKMCNPKIVDVILNHKGIDPTVTDNEASPAAYELGKVNAPKTLNWNEVRMLMSKADPQYATALSNLREDFKKKTTEESRKDAKLLTQTYVSNTSLVAILMATITFAAAFTLPGGYNSAGLPVMSSKFAFQAFLISDTLAMCASFAVAFVCIIARWEDYDFLIYYRSYIKKLMRFAYVTTTIAFSTGLYTVLAPRLYWLAIGICSLVALLPVLTELLGQWPVLKLRFLLDEIFESGPLDTP